MKVKVGDIISLRSGMKYTCPEDRENNRFAVVDAVDLYGCGGIMTDRDLRGCRFWNEDDVEVVSVRDLNFTERMSNLIWP